MFSEIILNISKLGIPVIRYNTIQALRTENTLRIRRLYIHFLTGGNHISPTLKVWLQDQTMSFSQLLDLSVDWMVVSSCMALINLYDIKSILNRLLKRSPLLFCKWYFLNYIFVYCKLHSPYFAMVFLKKNHFLSYQRSLFMWVILHGIFQLLLKNNEKIKRLLSR